MQRVVVICGPTASGKTALAVEVAEKLGAEIVSADSQQCYRGLDSATAKPTPEERARARHHLLDVAEPEEQLDALLWVLDPPRDVLRSRIEARTGRMFADGSLRRETEWLIQRGATKALKIIGYAECAEALQTGDWALAEERTNARTWQYARRQRTWFAKDAGAPLQWPFDAVRLCEEAGRWYEGAPS